MHSFLDISTSSTSMERQILNYSRMILEIVSCNFQKLNVEYYSDMILNLLWSSDQIDLVQETFTRPHGFTTDELSSALRLAAHEGTHLAFIKT